MLEQLSQQSKRFASLMSMERSPEDENELSNQDAEIRPSTIQSKPRTGSEPFGVALGSSA